MAFLMEVHVKTAYSTWNINKYPDRLIFSIQISYPATLTWEIQNDRHSNDINSGYQKVFL